MKQNLTSGAVIAPSGDCRVPASETFLRALKMGEFTPGADFEPSPVRKQIIELLCLRRPKHIHHPVD